MVISSGRQQRSFSLELAKCHPWFWPPFGGNAPTEPNCRLAWRAAVFRLETPIVRKGCINGSSSESPHANASSVPEPAPAAPVLLSGLPLCKATTAQDNPMPSPATILWALELGDNLSPTASVKNLEALPTSLLSNVNRATFPVAAPKVELARCCFDRAEADNRASARAADAILSLFFIDSVREVRGCFGCGCFLTQKKIPKSVEHGRCCPLRCSGLKEDKSRTAQLVIVCSS